MCLLWMKCNLCLDFILWYHCFFCSWKYYVLLPHISCEAVIGLDSRTVKSIGHHNRGACLKCCILFGDFLFLLHTNIFVK